MRLLLGSGGFRTPERVAFLTEQIRSFFGDVARLLFVPYALRDHDAYAKALTDKGIHAGYPLDGTHRHPDPVAAVREAAGARRLPRHWRRAGRTSSSAAGRPQPAA